MQISFYANFSIVFGPNFRGAKVSEGGQTASEGRPLPPLWKKASLSFFDDNCQWVCGLLKNLFSFLLKALKMVDDDSISCIS